MKAPQKKYKSFFLNDLLVFLSIATSGITFFSGVDFFELSLFIITLALFIYKDLNIDPQAFLIVFLFLLIEVFQHFLHGDYSYRTSVGTFVKLTTAYFLVKLVKDKFIGYYVNILYIFTIISLVFYSLSFIPGFVDFLINEIAPFFESPFRDPNAFYKATPNIIIFNFEGTLLTEFRNSGPFWEPGGFAIFLILALLFNLVKTKILYSKKNGLFIIALITTFSTAGYIALFIVISGYYILNRKASSKLTLFIFLGASISIYTNTSFLEKKIDHNMYIADETTSSRFGSAIADYNLFIESPVIGWGRGPMRYGGDEVLFFGQEQHRNNGIFILLATYGILGSFLYYFLFYKSLLTINTYFKFKKMFAYVMFATILALGFSQNLFLKPFFFSFLFFFLVIKSKKNTKKLKIS